MTLSSGPRLRPKYEIATRVLQQNTLLTPELVQRLTVVVVTLNVQLGAPHACKPLNKGPT